MAVNFLDLDLAEPDFEQSCEAEHLLLSEASPPPSSLLGRHGAKFCGKRLPNSPGPSVVVSGRYKQAADK